MGGRGFKPRLLEIFLLLLNLSLSPGQSDDPIESKRTSKIQEKDRTSRDIKSLTPGLAGEFSVYSVCSVVPLCSLCSLL